MTLSLEFCSPPEKYYYVRLIIPDSTIRKIQKEKIMKTKFPLCTLLTLILSLNACSPFTITNSSGEQPTLEVKTLPVTGYRPVPVEQNVQILQAATAA
jgi:hypothetical protein